ncbi:Uncharacterised protein [Mycobacteroides abscessus subsp. abscessus]|nr:Uncharacterised protein [Mycobacteroides abscessus subsp. abscessus]
MCRYHWPGVPSASVTRSHAGPPKMLTQLFGGSSPFSPRPSRKMYRARSGLPGPAASASMNHWCWSLVWLGTRSIVTRISRSCASAISSSKVARSPKSGSMSRGSETSYP